LRDFIETRGMPYEILYVDDGSSDNSILQIRQLVSENKSVRYIQFSRNFGKEAATSAGLHNCRGDIAVILDADGQFPLELIDKFLEQWRAGADVVVGVRRSNQNEGYLKRYGSKVFNWMMSPLTGGRSVAGETDFRLIDRVVIDKFGELSERTRITRGLIDWLGFKRVYIPFAARARTGGKATYTPKKLFKLALHTFVSQSTRPLLFTGLLGAFVMIASILAGIFMITEQYVLHDPLHLAITGTAVLAAFLSFLIGIVLVCQGLLALYIESIHSETQNRPLYVIREESS
jgi:dolichol-phosphate mannosyltransferase